MDLSPISLADRPVESIEKVAMNASPLNSHQKSRADIWDFLGRISSTWNFIKRAKYSFLTNM
jgi:hypothetical protein